MIDESQDGDSCESELVFSTMMDFEKQESYLVQQVIMALGVQKDIDFDVGYMYYSASQKQEVSGCTAPQLMAIHEMCLKGRWDSNPPCSSSSPDTTPTTGTPIAKGEVLINSTLAQTWTETDTRNELNEASRLFRLSLDLSQVRFQLHSQVTIHENWDNSNVTNLLNTSAKYGSHDAENNDYNIVMYQFEAESKMGTFAGQA